MKESPLKQLRELTMARVDLGRAGNSLPTRDVLDFQLAHARARDAVYHALEPGTLALPDGHSQVVVHSAARDRTEYLRRPDLGRRLADESKARLAGMLEQAGGGPFDVAFVVADGLSALAVHRHASALLTAIFARLDPVEWRIAPLVIVEQGRVAIADEIGEALRASISVILIGERPGLSSPDSLGIYITWGPRVGRTDAERNCISNIRADGLSPTAAAALLELLVSAARANQLSGVALSIAPERRVGE